MKHRPNQGSHKFSKTLAKVEKVTNLFSHLRISFSDIFFQENTTDCASEPSFMLFVSIIFLFHFSAKRVSVATIS